MFEVSTARLPATALMIAIALHWCLPTMALAQDRAASVSVAQKPDAGAASAPPLVPLVPLVPHYAPDAELLGAFGGKPGIEALADSFVDQVRGDRQVGHYFEKTKLPRFKTQIADQICQLLAGPCVYDGDSMQASHADLHIPKADFLRVVELLQSSMDQRGIPFAVQNQLLARLAPMHRDIITR